MARHRREVCGIDIVGARHGRPVVYRVQTGQMQKDGFLFYRSVNGVWLTKQVPVRYLERDDEA